MISHNKTLAAQLYSEFKQFFPRNAVEYFVSYFDYYQPEAYIPRSDTYIEKDSSINEEIERLRLAATSALLSRRDVIVVASVSCIYGITSREDYEQMLLTVKRGQHTSREAVLGRLVDMLYERNDVNFARGRFRVRGDVVEVYPASADEEGIRLEFFGDEIDAIRRFDPSPATRTNRSTSSRFFPPNSLRDAGRQTKSCPAHDSRQLEQRIVELESQNNYSRRSGCACALNMIWRCCRRWGSATGLRIIRAICLDVRRAPSLTRSWISSRKISWWWSTNRTPQSHKSAGCTKATARARLCS